MTGAAHQAVLWNRVLVLAESMDDPQLQMAQLRASLCALDEGFVGSFDPAEHFPEFVAHRLCRSMGRLLARLDVSAQPDHRA